MPENRLDIILGARIDNLRRDFRAAENEAKKAASNIADSIASAGDGGQAVQDAVRGIIQAFDRSEAEGRQALARLADESTETGQAIRKAFANSDRSVDGVEKEVDQLVKSLGELGKARRDIDQLSNAFGELQKEADSAAKAIDFQTGLDGARAIADDISSLAGTFSEAGEEARTLERQIALAFNSPQDIQRFTALAKDLKNEFQGLVDADELALGIQRASTLGVASEKNLRRFINVAKATGKGIDDVADDFGEFLADVNSGVVDPDVLETIRASFGIGAKELAQYGARLDENGKLQARNREEIKLAQQALIAFVDQNERFAGVAERSADAQSRFQAEIAKFNESVGESTNELKAQVAEALLPYVKSLNETSPAFKTFIAGSTQAVSATAQFGAKAVELAAFARIAGAGLGGPLAKGARAAATAITGLSVASAAMVAGLAAAAAGLAVITKSAFDYAKSLQEVETAQQSLLQTQSRILTQDKERARFIRQNVASIKAETDAIEDAGKRRVAVTDAILAKQVALTKAEDEGNGSLVAEIKGQISELRNLRSEYDRVATARQAQAALVRQAEVQASEDAREAFQKFKRDLGDGLFDSNAQALKDLEALSAGLTGGALQEALAERRKLQQEVLKTEVDSLKQQVDARKVSVEDSRQIFASLVSTYQANTDQRRELEKDFTAFLKGEGEERLAIQQQLDQRSLELKRSNLEIQKEVSDFTIQGLQRELEAGGQVTQQLENEIEKRKENLQQIAEEDAALARLQARREADSQISANPEQRSRILDQLAEQERQINRQTVLQKQQIEQQAEQEIQKIKRDGEKRELDAAKKKAQQEAQRASIARSRFEEEARFNQELLDQRKEALDIEAASGADVGQKRLDLEKEIRDFQETTAQARLDFVKREVEARRDAANVGATDSEKELNDERAKLDILKAQRAEKDAIRSELDTELAKEQEKTAELVKQRDALKEQNDERKKASGFDTSFGTTSGVENINNFGGGFGQSRFREATTEDGRTLADVEQELSRQRVRETEAREAAGIGANGQPLQTGQDLTVLQDTALQQSNLLSQMLTALQTLNQTQARIAQASSATAPDNFADRNLAQSTPNTLRP